MKNIKMLMILICFLSACKSGSEIKPVTQPTQCNIQHPDADGYLKAICEHLVDQKRDVSPGKADGYEIRSVVPSVEAGREVVRVYLNCCYTGDLAVIDLKTKKVIQFSLGPK